MTTFQVSVGGNMSVVKIVHLVGQSSESFAKAADEAVNEAALTIRNIKSFQVDQLSGEVENGKIARYRASVQIAFVVDRNEK
jgi:flavin-binding protein dodecin